MNVSNQVDLIEFPAGSANELKTPKRFQFKDPAGNELAVWSE